MSMLRKLVDPNREELQPLIDCLNFWCEELGVKMVVIDNTLTFMYKKLPYKVKLPDKKGETAFLMNWYV